MITEQGIFQQPAAPGTEPGAQPIAGTTVVQDPLVPTPPQPAEPAAPAAPVVSSPVIDPTLIPQTPTVPAPLGQADATQPPPAAQPPATQPIQYAAPLSQRIDEILRNGGSLDDVFNLVNVQRHDPERMTPNQKVEAFLGSKYPEFGNDERNALLQAQYGFDPENPDSAMSRVAIARAADEAHRYLSERKVAVTNPAAAAEAAQRQQQAAAEAAQRQVYAIQWDTVLNAALPSLSKVEVRQKSPDGEYQFDYQYSPEAAAFAKDFTKNVLLAGGKPPDQNTLQQASQMFHMIARGYDFDRYNAAILADMTSAATLTALKRLSGPPAPTAPPGDPQNSAPAKKEFWQRPDL